MYDLKNDPQEVTSIFGQAESQAVQKELETELARLRRELQVTDADPPASAIPQKKK